MDYGLITIINNFNIKTSKKVQKIYFFFFLKKINKESYFY